MKQGWKGFGIVLGVVLGVLAIYHLLGGDDKFFDSEGFGIMGWISLIAILLMGIIFYMIYKKQ